MNFHGGFINNTSVGNSGSKLSQLTSARFVASSFDSIHDTYPKAYNYSNKRQGLSRMDDRYLNGSLKFLVNSNSNQPTMTKNSTWFGFCVLKWIQNHFFRLMFQAPVPSLACLVSELRQGFLTSSLCPLSKSHDTAKPMFLKDLRRRRRHANRI